MAGAVCQPVGPSGIKTGFSLAGCWADAVSVLLGRCCHILLPAPLLPPSVSSLSCPGGPGKRGEVAPLPQGPPEHAIKNVLVTSINLVLTGTVSKLRKQPVVNCSCEGSESEKS